MLLSRNVFSRRSGAIKGGGSESMAIWTVQPQRGRETNVFVARLKT